MNALREQAAKRDRRIKLLALDALSDIEGASKHNSDGLISRQELEDVLRFLQTDLTNDEFERLFKAADLNGDSELDYEEFCLRVAHERWPRYQRKDIITSPPHS